VKKIQSYSLQVMAGFIVGFDHDPEDIFERQIQFIQESAIPLAMVELVDGASRHTALATARARRATIWKHEGTTPNGSLNFVPKMDTACLVEGYQSILRTIYSPGEYYQRALNCLERVPVWAPEPRRSGCQRRGDSLSHRAGARRARPCAWRVLALPRCALTQHRERFAEAVRLAALGYHFRKLTEGLCK
jgi:hypothetical protein